MLEEISLLLKCTQYIISLTHNRGFKVICYYKEAGNFLFKTKPKQYKKGLTKHKIMTIIINTNIYTIIISTNIKIILSCNSYLKLISIEALNQK